MDLRTLNALQPAYKAVDTALKDISEKAIFEESGYTFLTHLHYGDGVFRFSVYRTETYFEDAPMHVTLKLGVVTINDMGSPTKVDAYIIKQILQNL